MKRYLLLVLSLSIVFTARSGWTQDSITVCSYGGTYNKAWEEAVAKPFTQATGIKVILTTYPTTPQMEAQVKTGNIEWDVVEVENRMYARGVKAGIFEPLDLSMINAQDFIKGTVKRYGVGCTHYSYGIAYNTKVWPAGQGPKSMKDFWDVNKFPGPRTTKIYALFNLEAALLADGVSKDKIYPIDVDRALKKMTEIKPHIRVYFKAAGTSQQIMREREADLGILPIGRMIQLAEQGVPIAWEWNEQLVVLDYWTILKGTKKKEAAMKFIAFASQPKSQAGFSNAMNYGPANLKAYDFIKKEKAVLMPTYSENFAKGMVIDEDWYGQYEEEVERKWEAWRMAK